MQSRHYRYTHRQTTVVNIKNEKCTIYCGRGTIWGNPYRMREGRDRSIVLRNYYMHALANNLDRGAATLLKGEVLGCHCKPLDCHCDILADWANFGSPRYVCYGILANEEVIKTGNSRQEVLEFVDLYGEKLLSYSLRYPDGNWMITRTGK